MAVAGYELRYRNITDGGAYTIVDVGNVLTYPVTLAYGKQYGGQVRAYDAAGNYGEWYTPEQTATTGPLDPASITGLVRWYRPEGLASLADGDAISSWTDSSTSAVAATAAGTSLPVCKTGIANGLRVARFDGVDDSLLIGDLSAVGAAGAGSGEVFLVVKLVADPAAAGTSGGLWHIGSGVSAQFTYTGDGVIYDQFGSNARFATVDPALDLSAAFRIYSVYSAPNDWQNYLNGVSLWSTATNGVDFSTACYLGASGNPLDNFMHGDIAEFILYDHKLTGPERTSVVSYLQSKYAI